MMSKNWFNCPTAQWSNATAHILPYAIFYPMPARGKTFATVISEAIGIVAEDEEKKQKSLLEKKKNMPVEFNAKTTMSLNGMIIRVHGVLWSIWERECLNCQAKMEFGLSCLSYQVTSVPNQPGSTRNSLGVCVDKGCTCKPDKRKLLEYGNGLLPVSGAFRAVITCFDR